MGFQPSEAIGQRLRDIHSRLLMHFENTYLSVLARNQQQNVLNAAHIANMNRALTPSGGASNVPGRPGGPNQAQPQPQPQITGPNGYPGAYSNPQNPQNPQVPPGTATALQQMQFKALLAQTNMSNDQLRSQGHSQAQIEAIERKRDFLNRQVQLGANGALLLGQPHQMPPQGQAPPTMQQPGSSMVPSHHTAPQQTQPHDASPPQPHPHDFAAAQQAMNAQRGRVLTPQPRPNSGLNVPNQPPLQPPPMGRQGGPQPGPGLQQQHFARPSEADLKRAGEWINAVKLQARGAPSKN